MKIINIIQFAKEGKNIAEIAEIFGKSISTINRYISILRSKGYKVPIRMGRPQIKID